MDMTFSQYINNPMRSAVFTTAMRESMNQEYRKKFDAIMVREHGKLFYNFYKDKQNRLYGYFKIPSEVIDKFYYDVVVEFTGNEKVKELGINLFEYNVRFFSNDPSFVYTYAHTFYNNDLFIKELRSKMSNKAIKKAAKERNPTDQVGYVKALYFVYLAMVNKGLYFRDNVEPAAIPISSMDTLKALITDTDRKIEDREAAGVRLQRKKKREKEQETRRKEAENKTNTTVKIKNISTTKKLNTINKATKTVGKVKRK